MDGRRRCDERQRDNQPDKRRKRGAVRGRALVTEFYVHDFRTQHNICSICKYDVVSYVFVFLGMLHYFVPSFTLKVLFLLFSTQLVLLCVCFMHKTQNT